jgi:hypothetical protein
MDTFDLRKFLAESRQPIQEMDAPMEVEPPMEGETMEEIVAEYVTEALEGQNIKEVTGIIERTCNKAMYEMKMEVIAEVISAYEGRLSEIKETAYFQEMVDEAKLAAQEGMINGLHEMAIAVKEEYKKTYMPEEEKVEEKKAPKKEEDKKEDKKEKEEK